MKKTANISFSIIYILFTIGVAISSHYCMGKVSDHNIFSFDNHGCMCDDMMGDDHGCCDDELAIVSIEDEQQVTTQLASIVPRMAILFTFDIETVLKDHKDIDLLAFIGNFGDPPPKLDRPLYLLNCNYTFYG